MPGVENVCILMSMTILVHLIKLVDLQLFCINFCVQLQVDVTELVDGHSSYLSAAQQILEHLELNAYYPVFVPLPAVSK